MNTNSSKQNKALLKDNDQNKMLLNHELVKLCKDNLPKYTEKKTLKQFNKFSEEGNII